MLKNRDEFCRITDSYNHSEPYNSLFVESMKEVTVFHKENNAFYAKLLKKENFNIASLKTVDDCAAIPYTYADFFKTHVVKSIPDDQIVEHFTSSGTSGQMSQMFFDERTIGDAIRMVDSEIAERGFLTPDQPSNYIMYAYDIPEGSKLGTANTDKRLTKYSPINEIEYALKQDGLGGYEFDVFGIMEAFKRYAKQDLPVRILGFPSFFYFTLERMKRLGMNPLKLNPNSLALFGGGWKGYAGKQIAKSDLYALGEEMLGIPEERFCDGFGSVEHCVPYTECTKHHFHVPTWSRVFIRDMKNLEVLPYGKPGFIQFVSPYITSAPAHSIVMGDMAVLHPAEECGCGIQTPWFEILGRAGTSKNKSCAIAASELLKR
jgi:phenylacetate-coenzyme A ligase PaaK-like adenylate-forming protein